MADLAVSSLTIDELLRKLKGREWLIPQFQREFVWSVGDVIELVNSILSARPIGMTTIWEQADDKTLELAPLSLPDRLPPDQAETRTLFCDTDDNPKKVFAVLDGLQRCTAIAMAFGGFRTEHGDYRTTGRYFLNVAAPDPLEQIAFLKETEVSSRQYNSDATCISQGYFPLSTNLKNESFLGQWLRYIQAIRDPGFYPNGQLPPQTELERRNEVLKRAFEGITKTKLAVYIVPDTYSLADICEIFEKLNTTGTKVSTVDLIHSWLYADTSRDATGPIRLREWIDDLGQKEGAIGWADTNGRPELVVQMATACHVALDKKTAPRRVGRSPSTSITSVKAGDLLATPTEHWKLFINSDSKIAGFLSDFQSTVAAGVFPWNWCPYPVTSSAYVAIRAHYHFDLSGAGPWGVDDLNSLFRAFFWRTALTNRYDQGFLTQIGVDIKELKRLLELKRGKNTAGQWATSAEPELQKLIGRPLPSKEDLVEYITDGRPTGAMQKALYLPMLAGATKDLLDGSISLRYSQQDSLVHLHHIYPRDWCRNNVTGRLRKILDPKKAGRDWVNSVANLMPLSRQSNNIWKAKNPGQVLVEREITYSHSQNILARAFIDRECFEFLLKGADGIEQFWSRRASIIADDLLKRMTIQV